MVQAVPSRSGQEPRYVGLRLTAEEYLRLEDDGFPYQLVHGVVVMSPKPSYEHQDVAGFVYAKLREHVVAKDLGKALFEVDVQFTPDVVYAPDIVFYSKARVPARGQKIGSAPDFVIEFLSPGSRLLDLRTKRDDYAAFGVREYWVIDPITLVAVCWKLDGGVFVEAAHPGDALESVVIAGFVLRIPDLRQYMQ
jgi:Uma2 family endonuclease